MQLSEIPLAWTTHSFLRRGTAQIGEWTVSVVVGEAVYCEPRQDHLPIDSYTEVEVAVLKPIPGKKRPFYWTMKETPVGEYFSEGDNLAPYISIEALSEIMQYLQRLRYSPTAEWLRYMS